MLPANFSVIMFAGTEYESHGSPATPLQSAGHQPTECVLLLQPVPYQLECLDIPRKKVVAAGLNCCRGYNLQG